MVSIACVLDKITREAAKEVMEDYNIVMVVAVEAVLELLVQMPLVLLVVMAFCLLTVFSKHHLEKITKEFLTLKLLKIPFLQLLVFNLVVSHQLDLPI